MGDAEQVTLRAKEGQEFSLRREVALKMKVLADMLEEDIERTAIPVDVEGPVLANVVTYYNWHADNEGAPDSDKKAYDQAFLSNMKRAMLLETMIAANYLHATELLDATVVFFGRLISNKDPDGIREVLGIQTPFQPGEIEAAIAQNRWTFKVDTPPAQAN